MKVYLEPMFGDTYSNTKRAKIQLAKALGFRGTITEIKAERKYIVAEITISTRWELSPRERAKYLREWLPTRVHHFKVSLKKG
jgi:hypothetical protein